MPKPVSRRELIRKLKQFGFVGPCAGGRHQFMERRKMKIIIPNPHGKDIGSSLLSQIIRDVGISPGEFENV